MLNITTLYTQSRIWLRARPSWAPHTASRAERQPLFAPTIFQPAFQRAYRRFAQQHSDWVQRRFDDDFLRAVLDASLLQDLALAISRLPLLWDKQFGPLASPDVRLRQLVELRPVAADFLQLLQAELAQPTA